MTEAPDEKDELLARYLLNELSQGENEDLEDRMVLDAELSERRETVELSLIDSYVMDEMTPDERLRFERGFLLFPENRVKVEEARLLHESLRTLRKERLAKHEGQPTTRPEVVAPSRRRWFVPIPPLAFAALTALLVLGLGYFLIPWRDVLRGPTGNPNLAADQGPRTTPSVVPELNATPDSNSAEGPNVNQSPTPPVSQPSPEAPEIAMLPPRPETVSRTIVERPGPVDGGPTRGPESRRVEPQVITVPRGSKFLELKMTLLPGRAAENKRPLAISVYRIDDLDDPVFPAGDGLLLTPVRVGKRKPSYVVTVAIPTRLLQDGETYYVRVDEEATATSFKVRMTNAGR